MSERRFFIDKQNIIGKSAVLIGDEHEHLSLVLRLKTGDSVVLCDGTGKEYTAQVDRIEKSKTHLNIESELMSSNEAKTYVTLYQGLIKGEKMDLVVQKTTELGVSRIVPFTSQFTVVENSKNKNERFNKIALSAAKQCRRALLPEILETQSFENVRKMIKSEKNVILAYENEKTNTLSEALKNVKTSVALIVGAEGGFSEKEVNELVNAGAKCITLGKRILRAETAAIALISATMYELKEWE